MRVGVGEVVNIRHRGLKVIRGAADVSAMATTLRGSGIVRMMASVP